MHTHNLPMHLFRALGQARFAAGALVTLALLSAASGDSASPVNSSTLRSGMSGSPSAAASTVVVLANASVTCTNGTITGDVGTFLPAPTGSVTKSSCPIAGTVHVGDAAAKQAFNDFLNTYAALAPKAGNVCKTLTGTLAGITLTGGTFNGHASSKADVTITSTAVTGC